MNITAEIASRQNEVKTHQYNAAIIIGVGGIGSWVAMDLALSGRVGSIAIVDPDTIESSNC